MKFINAREFHGKSGCSLGRTLGSTRPEPLLMILVGRGCCAKYAIASYILRVWIKREVETRLKRSADAAG